jgi:hypothetical protein
VVRCSKVGPVFAETTLLREPLQYLDPAFDSAKLAMRQAAKACDQAARGCSALVKERPALLGQPKCEAAAVGGVGGAVDVAGLDQRFDRAASGRGTSTRSLSDLTERCGFMRRDSRQKRPRGAVGALGLAVVVERFEQRRQARGDCLRRGLIPHFARLQQFLGFDNCLSQLR